jgi:hypothetical protein
VSTPIPIMNQHKYMKLVNKTRFQHSLGLQVNMRVSLRSVSYWPNMMSNLLILDLGLV